MTFASCSFCFWGPSFSCANRGQAYCPMLSLHMSLHISLHMSSHVPVSQSLEALCDACCLDLVALQLFHLPVLSTASTTHSSPFLQDPARTRNLLVRNVRISCNHSRSLGTSARWRDMTGCLWQFQLGAELLFLQPFNALVTLRQLALQRFQGILRVQCWNRRKTCRETEFVSYMERTFREHCVNHSLSFWKNDPHLDQNTSIIQYPHISLPTENIWASSASAGVEVARMDAIMLAAAAFRTAWGKPRPKTNLELQRENEKTIDQPTFQQHTCAQHSSINMFLFFFFILQSLQGYAILINPR